MKTAESNPRLRSFLVECYSPGIERDEVAAAGDRSEVAAEALRRTGREIEYVRALLVPLDEVVFHLFVAQDASLVREAVSRASVTYERIVESIVVETASVAMPTTPD
jgi:hypothetical protein